MQKENHYIKELRDNLTELNPHLVLLFGSYAYGNPNENSDIDLIVVTRDNYVPQNFSERTALYLKVNECIRHIARQVPIDLIVYTLPMYQKFLDLHSSFSREILNKGVILYERNDSGMA